MIAPLLSVAYFAPVSYYCRLLAYPQVQMEQWEHFVKQTYRNRMVIASEGGPKALCVPVDRHLPQHSPIRDLRISDHGNWRHLHWQALVSAYENSPYFEYYADDFRPFYEKKIEFLVDFDEQIRAKVCELLGLNVEVSLTEKWESAPQGEDFRMIISPKGGNADCNFQPKPYYQVFADRSGFLPDLSIADLLFNMGPEAVFTLRDSWVK